MGQNFGVWPESNWTSGDIDWRKAQKITAGVDIGTTSSQAAIMADGRLFGYANIRTGPNFKTAADNAIKKAMGDSGLTLSDIGGVVATGFGRSNAGFATSTFSEIHCHGKGARFMFGPSVVTVVDLGGQTTKALRLYEWDRLRDFKVSDKCATGFGRHIEEMAELFEMPLQEMIAKSLELDLDNDPEPVSHTCGNFAYPEAIGLLREGFREAKYTVNDIIGSYILAVSWRIMGTIGKLLPLDIGDIRVYKELAFTGGLAKNKGVTKRLERDLGVTALTSEYDPQLAGAIGAALLA